VNVRKVGDRLVSARLQVLQSKRLLLASQERRLQQRAVERLPEHVRHLREEIEEAQALYRATLVRWGSPMLMEYWPAAYGHLIDLADGLGRRLEDAAKQGSVSRGYELALEVEVVDQLIASWRQALREALLKASA
jgi:hypothetical protein